jgi:hypothetical protein
MPDFGLEPEWYWDDLPEPDDADRAHYRFLGLFPMDDANFDPVEGHFIDPQMDRAASRWDREEDDLPQLYAAALYLRGWRLARRVAFPAWPLALLLTAAVSDTFPEPERTADGRPVDDLTPDAGDRCARILLMAPAAPPPPVIASAGATG